MDNLYLYFNFRIMYVQCGPSMTSWVNPHPSSQKGVDRLKRVWIDSNLRVWIDSIKECGLPQYVIDGPHCILKLIGWPKLLGSPLRLIKKDAISWSASSISSEVLRFNWGPSYYVFEKKSWSTPYMSLEVLGLDKTDLY